MVKTILLIALIYIGSASLASSDTAEKRLCRGARGDFDQVKIAKELVGICQIGSSTIGAMDLVDLGGPYKGSATSLEAYGQGLRACSSGSGKVIKVKSVAEKKDFSLCLYHDGSLMDVKTISTGKQAGQNRSLNTIIGI